VSGRATGGAEFVAVTNGTVPNIGVGLFTLNEVAVEARVAIEEVEFERVGLLGRTPGAGDGVCPAFVFVVVASTGVTLLKDGEVAMVGVGRGVEFAEETAVERG